MDCRKYKLFFWAKGKKQNQSFSYHKHHSFFIKKTILKILKHKITKSKFSLFDLDSFGKDVFLTKEEAEAKLKEMEEEK